MKQEIRFDFKEVFDPEDYLYFYKSTLTPERLNAEIDFLIKHTELTSPLQILDLECGHGRHANVLAAKGHFVKGIDASEDFLKIAQEGAKQMGVKVDYTQGDMGNFNYQDAFDRVYSLFTAIGYFNDVENERVFRNIYRALRPGGLFCFDSHNRDAFLTHILPAIVSEREGNLMIDQFSFDTITGHNTTKRTVLRDKNFKTYEFSVRLYNPTEILRLFNEIGVKESLEKNDCSRKKVNSVRWAA
jgi:SAM-dependent methyltransferase